MGTGTIILIGLMVFLGALLLRASVRRRRFDRFLRDYALAALQEERDQDAAMTDLAAATADARTRMEVIVDGEPLSPRQTTDEPEPERRSRRLLGNGLIVIGSASAALGIFGVAGYLRADQPRDDARPRRSAPAPSPAPSPPRTPSPTEGAANLRAVATVSRAAANLRHAVARLPDARKRHRIYRVLDQGASGLRHDLIDTAGTPENRKVRHRTLSWAANLRETTRWITTHLAECSCQSCRQAVADGLDVA